MVDKFKAFESIGAARAEAISLPNVYRFLGGLGQREISPYPRAGDPKGGPTAKYSKHKHLPPDLDAEEQEEERMLRWVGLSHLPSEDDDDDTDDADDFDGSATTSFQARRTMTPPTEIRASANSLSSDIMESLYSRQRFLAMGLNQKPRILESRRPQSPMEGGRNHFTSLAEAHNGMTATEKAQAAYRVVAGSIIRRSQ